VARDPHTEAMRLAMHAERYALRAAKLYERAAVLEEVALNTTSFNLMQTRLQLSCSQDDLSKKYRLLKRMLTPEKE